MITADTDGFKVFAAWNHQGMILPRCSRAPAQLAKFIVDVATGEVEDRAPTPEEQGKDPAAVAMGKKGGAARAGATSG